MAVKSTVMLKQDIRILYETCKKRGYILDKEKKCFSDMHEIYTACGGNSFVSEQIKPFIDSLRCYETEEEAEHYKDCLLYTSPSPRD